MQYGTISVVLVGSREFGLSALHAMLPSEHVGRASHDEEQKGLEYSNRLLMIKSLTSKCVC